MQTPGPRLPRRWPARWVPRKLRSFFERRWRKHRGHPVRQLLLLVRELADVVLGVLELTTPEQRVVGADLDADAAVHAEGVIDREPVEHVALARTPTLPLRWKRLLVRIDVDAPVGAFARAQHADGAVFFLESDDAAGARGEILLLVWILDDGVVLEEMLEGHGHALQQPDDRKPRLACLF